MAADSLCLENIDEFVHDENKIVTCKWLSLTLKIHINQAKRLLYTFLQQQQKQDKKVNATYFLAGLSKGDNGAVEHRCAVVTEGDLESARSQLSTVTSCHVFSIQRADLKDSNLLYMTDYEGVKENLTECNKYSSIRCQRASVPRTQPVQVKTEKAQEEGAGNMGSRQDAQKEKESVGADKARSTVPATGKAKKAEPKGSIASMFAKSQKKNPTDAEKKKESSRKEDTKENKPAGKKGGVMALFANAKPVAKTKARQVEKDKPVSKETNTLEKKVSNAAELKRKKHSGSRADSDAEEQPGRKRRRRIKNDLFDSSSDEEMEIEAESPVPSPVREQTPEPESPVPAKRMPEKSQTDQPSAKDNKAANGSKLRRRKRKLVPKTYMDDDGFMVTEKVWESESTDASEVEEETKKKAAAQKKPNPSPVKKNSPQKKGSPAKGKQTSLMSFFPKK